MQRAGRCLRRFIESEDAIAITEYGMLIALVAIGLIAVVSIFGSQISSWFLAKTGSVTTV
jgi:Flp pilus assembly pilin Flp